MSLRTDRARLVLLVKRKATLSKEAFHHYWSGTHGALFSSLDIVKTNLLKYEQVCRSPDLPQAAIMELIGPYERKCNPTTSTNDGFSSV